MRRRTRKVYQHEPLWICDLKIETQHECSCRAMNYRKGLRVDLRRIASLANFLALVGLFEVKLDLVEQVGEELFLREHAVHGVATVDRPVAGDDDDRHSGVFVVNLA